MLWRARTLRRLLSLRRQARARSAHGRSLRGAIAAAMARAAAIWAGFSISKISSVADISRPPLGRCSTITGAGGGVTSDASQGQRYWIQVWWKYVLPGTGAKRASG